jgi:hypothetical protein
MKYYYGERGKKLGARLRSPNEKKGGWAEKYIGYKDVPIDDRHPHIKKTIYRLVTKYHIPRTVIKNTENLRNNPSYLCQFSCFILLPLYL